MFSKNRRSNIVLLACLGCNGANAFSVSPVFTKGLSSQLILPQKPFLPPISTKTLPVAQLTPPRKYKHNPGLLMGFGPQQEQEHASDTVSQMDANETSGEISLFKEKEKNVLKDVDKNVHPITAFIAAICVFAAILFGWPNTATAVQSGGRMGGSFSAPSSRSSGSSRSYGGGGGGGRYSRSNTVHSYSRPSVVVTPGISPYYGSPFGSPFGFFGRGYGYGYGSPGVVAVSRGPSIFDVIVFGVVGFVLFNAFTATTGSGSSTWDTTTSTSSALGDGMSVVKLSIALDVSNRDDPSSILNVLSRLANTAKTDSRVGIQNLTSQVALELLRKKQSIVAGSSSYSHFRDFSKAQREFNNLSVRERGKFERETVSKYGGVDYSAQSRADRGGALTPKATAAVVTLVLAIQGDSTKIPTRINSIRDIESALSQIASDVKVDDCLQSAEILWTPEERTETLTQREVFADYPDLRSI
uniref:Uncharacterized protein n=1 Tax=Attheya septentrionalis TaxID=420275 RepID=A0A7S2UJC4_9STRA|mmetsp:Transcript_25512/g.46209  ORF Transcript_25512/g.46209 Transcript_25512/m.46209 type:complete len:471 (+) Transcript_25512:209-1621(+)